MNRSLMRCGAAGVIESGGLFRWRNGSRFSDFLCPRGANRSSFSALKIAVNAAPRHAVIFEKKQGLNMLDFAYEIERKG
jgi:hypothetical protein